MFAKAKLCSIVILTLSTAMLHGCSKASTMAAGNAVAAEAIVSTAPSNRAVEKGKMDHSHIPVAVPEGVTVPSLSIQVTRDWMSGLNLHLHTENYALVPPPSNLSMEALMQPSIQTETGLAEGHAHLYINGEKTQRIYGTHVHLPETLFKPGLNQISVSINNHGHMYWTAQNRQILSTLYINLDNEDLVTHRFESYPAMTNTDASMCAQASQAKAG